MATKHATKKTEPTREQVALAEVEAARLLLAEAMTRIADRELAVEDAEIAVEEIEDAWGIGDESKTALDHVTAISEVSRQKALLTAARATVTKAERAVMNTDTTLADLVARFVRESHPGVEVRSTFLAPDDTVNVVTVSQSEPSKRGGDGVLSGAVKVSYLRDRLYRDLSGQSIEEAALRAGMKVTASGVNTSPARTADENMECDSVTVKVEHAHEDVPVIASMGNSDSRFAQRLASDLAGAVGGTVSMKANGWFESSGALVNAEHNELSTSEDEDGNRRATLDVTLAYQRRGGNYMSSAAEGLAGGAKSIPLALRDLLDEYVGAFVPGLGVVAETDVLPNIGGQRSGSTAKVRVVCKSRMTK